MANLASPLCAFWFKLVFQVSLSGYDPPCNGSKDVSQWLRTPLFIQLFIDRSVSVIATAMNIVVVPVTVGTGRRRPLLGGKVVDRMEKVMRRIAGTLALLLITSTGLGSIRLG